MAVPVDEALDVQRVAVTAGTFDLFVEVICRETTHFTELLIEHVQRIDGVADTQSLLVLQIHKMAYGWGVPEVATPSTTRVVSQGGGAGET